MRTSKSARCNFFCRQFFFAVFGVWQGPRDRQDSEGQGGPGRGQVHLQQGLHQRTLQDQDQPGTGTCCVPIIISSDTRAGKRKVWFHWGFLKKKFRGFGGQFKDPFFSFY